MFNLLKKSFKFWYCTRRPIRNEINLNAPAVYEPDWVAHNFPVYPLRYWYKNILREGAKQWCTAEDYVLNMCLRKMLPEVPGSIIDLICDYTPEKDEQFFHGAVIKEIDNMFASHQQIFFLDASGNMVARSITGRKALQKILEDTFSYDCWGNNQTALSIFFDPAVRYIEYWRGGFMMGMRFPRTLRYQDDVGDWLQILQDPRDHWAIPDMDWDQTFPHKEASANWYWFEGGVKVYANGRIETPWYCVD